MDFEFCGSQPFTVKVSGDLGGGNMGSMTCPTTGAVFSASELTGLIKAVFAPSNPNQVLNEPYVHDAQFHNGSPTPVDDSWDLKATNTLVVAKVTLTHEPAK